jgi:similar to spore coat protein
MDFTKQPVNAVKAPMGNDYLEVENAEGMPGLADATVAMDFLIGVKSGIRNMAAAITEIADPDARVLVRGLLNAGIELHAELVHLMLIKEWIKPYKVDEQFRLDDISSRTALQIAAMDLFPPYTGRLGTFATPNE